MHARLNSLNLVNLELFTLSFSGLFKTHFYKIVGNWASYELRTEELANNAALTEVVYLPGPEQAAPLDSTARVRRKESRSASPQSHRHGFEPRWLGCSEVQYWPKLIKHYVGLFPS